MQVELLDGYKRVSIHKEHGTEELFVSRKGRVFIYSYL